MIKTWGITIEKDEAVTVFNEINKDNDDNWIT